MPNLDEAHADYERYWPPWIAVGAPWPPPGSGQRMLRYKKNEAIYKGDHDALMKPAWDRLLKSRGFTTEEIKALEVKIPICSQVSDFPADMLFGEKPIIKKDGLPEGASEWLEELDRLNGLQRVFYKGALSQSYRGEALIRVRHTGPGGRPVIEAQPPEFWYPYTNPDNVQEVWAHVIAWERTFGAPVSAIGDWWVRLLAALGLAPNTSKVTVLRAEVHFEGLIVHRMYQLKDGKLAKQLPLDLLPEYSADVHQEYEELPVKEFLIKHIPNRELDNQLHGLDDYALLESLQREINVRATQTGRVLDKNQSPLFYGPKQQEVFNEETGRYEVVKGFDGQWIAIEDGAEAAKPGAVTWDGHEAEAKEHTEQMFDFLLTVAGLNRAPWGDKTAGGQDAAAAIKRKLMRALATVGRKRIPWDSAIPDLFRLAMVLEQEANPEKITWEPFRPGLQWQDGLPLDESEQAKTLQTEVDAGIKSRETAIRELHPSWTTEQVQEELDRIQDEEAARTPPSSFHVPDDTLVKGPGAASTEEEEVA